jgi:hypothetical protein
VKTLFLPGYIDVFKYMYGIGQKGLHHKDGKLECGNALLAA